LGERKLRKSRKIVFFFPSFASSEATAPLGILAVATPLKRAGFEVVLIDSTITPNFKQRVLEEVKDALCLGISLVTGPMIRETVDIARSVKKWDPEFPIILGGWHPSLLPKQTLEAPYLDYIVRGQGEDSLLELVQHLRAGAAPDFIAGIGFKRDGRLIMTPERPLRPLFEMPQKAYELADFDAYERSADKVKWGGKRKIWQRNRLLQWSRKNCCPIIWGQSSLSKMIRGCSAFCSGCFLLSTTTW
jgi:anaerobic magnesium-protoporphyrin IX monomethyl ester cyclase